MAIGELPAHTHERGTMNITGAIIKSSISGYVDGAPMSGTGAFTTLKGNQWFNGPSNGSEKNGNYGASFDASKTWTGETSSVGGNAAHSLMQPFLSVFMWRRTN